MSLLPIVNPTWTPAQYMARFDSGDYIQKTGGLSNAVDGKGFTFVINLAASTVSSGCIFRIKEGIQIGISSNQFFVRAHGGASEGSWVLNANSTSTLNTTDNIQIYFAVNLASSSTRDLITNGSSRGMVWGTYSNSNINIANTETVTVCDPVSFIGGGGFYADYYDLWFDNQYLDPAIFLTSFWDSTTGKPKSLGEDGSLVTGVPPLMYINGFGNMQNSGTGGDFTTTGIITQGTIAPI